MQILKTAAMADVMLDLETLGTRPGSVILSVGAVEFSHEHGLGREFYEEISVDTSIEAGLTTDVSTVKWWTSQSKEARKTLDNCHKGDAKNLNSVLTAYRSWLQACKGGLPRVKVWGCGSDFDNVLLAAAYGVTKINYPVKFYNHRCFRTLKALPHNVPEPTRQGTYHNALDDAKHQATWAVAILQALHGKAVPDDGKGS